jgi:hypothetical protein
MPAHLTFASDKAGLVARRAELEQEAMACGYNEPIYRSRSGRRVLLGRTRRVLGRRTSRDLTQRTHDNS